MSRLKLLSALPALARSPLGRLRFLAVSATIPNVADIGAWIGAPPGYSPSFGDEYRACALDVKGKHAAMIAHSTLCCVRSRCDALRSAWVQPRQERLPLRAVRRALGTTRRCATLADASAAASSRCLHRRLAAT